MWHPLCKQVAQSQPLLFIPSGGVGSRLKPLPFKNEAALVDNIPFTEFIIATAVKYLGIKEVIFGLDGKNREHYSRTEYYYGNGTEFSHTWQVDGQPADFIYQPRYFLDYGNADSARRNLKRIRKLLPDTAARSTLVLQNDTLLHPEDLANLYLQTLETKPYMGVALMKVQEPWHYGVVTLDDQQVITSFQEKPPPSPHLSPLVSAGAYVLEPEVYPYLQRDFGKDVISRLVPEGWVGGYLCKHPVYDFGNSNTLLSTTLNLLAQPPDFLHELLSLHCQIIQVGKTRVYLRNGNKYEETIKQLIIEKINNKSILVKGEFVYIGSIECPDKQACDIVLENCAIGSGSRIWPQVHISSSNIFNGWDIRPGVKIHQSLLGRAGVIGPDTIIKNSIFGGENRIPQNQQLDSVRLEHCERL